MKIYICGTVGGILLFGTNDLQFSCRFNHPGEVMERRSMTLASNGGAPLFRDFEFARQELVQVQNEK